MFLSLTKGRVGIHLNYYMHIITKQSWSERKGAPVPPLCTPPLGTTLTHSTSFHTNTSAFLQRPAISLLSKVLHLSTAPSIATARDAPVIQVGRNLLAKTSTSLPSQHTSEIPLLFKIEAFRTATYF